MEDRVILVDENDHETGSMEKMEAHVLGRLHRAFSVFIFNSKGQLLLQQRALDKYHSGGRWTNTCCSHPRTGEDTEQAAHRRLYEEMGMRCKLKHAFSFIYEAIVNETLIEHEYDHVYFGESDELPGINTAEVAAFTYMQLDELKQDIAGHPEKYTEWLKICLGKVTACRDKKEQ